MSEITKTSDNAISPDEESATNALSEGEKIEEKTERESINETKTSDEAKGTNEETDPISNFCNDDVDAVSSGQISPPADTIKIEDESRSTTGVESNIRGNEIAGSNSESKTVPGYPVRVNSTDEDEGKDINVDQKDEDGTIKENIQNEPRTNEEDENCATIDQSVDTNVVNGDQQEEDPESSGVETTENDAKPASTNKDVETVEENDNVKLESTENSIEQPSSTSKKPSNQLLSEREAKDQDGKLSLNMKSSFIGAGTSSPEEEKPKTNSQNENMPTDGKASGSTNGAQSSENTSESSGPSSQASPARNGETANSGDQYKAYINIPEFLWSSMHQRLLGDLLFAIESDLQVWRR